jgi:hypothetical protein
MPVSSAPASVLMQVEGLAKRYGDQRALRGMTKQQARIPVARRGVPERLSCS